MLTLICHSAPHGKPPGHMAAFQAGMVVPDEDKSAGKERIYSTWYSFIFTLKPCRIQLVDEAE